jgi:hypothetical protein
MRMLLAGTRNEAPDESGFDDQVDAANGRQPIRDLVPCSAGIARVVDSAVARSEGHVVALGRQRVGVDVVVEPFGKTVRAALEPSVAAEWSAVERRPIAAWTVRGTEENRVPGNCDGPAIRCVKAVAAMVPRCSLIIADGESTRPECSQDELVDRDDVVYVGIQVDRCLPTVVAASEDPPDMHVDKRPAVRRDRYGAHVRWTTPRCVPHRPGVGAVEAGDAVHSLGIALEQMRTGEPCQYSGGRTGDARDVPRIGYVDLGPPLWSPRIERSIPDGPSIADVIDPCIDQVDGAVQMVQSSIGSDRNPHSVMIP